MRSVTLKNWLLLASVSCGVGFGSTFLISRNLQQSALAGLGTVPAVAASMTILSRQRKEEIDRQVTRLKSSLDSLEGEERLARDQLQLTQSTHQQIDRQVQELISQQAKLTTISTELAQMEARRQFTIDSAEKSDLELQRIHAEINQQSVKKEQLEVRVDNLQHQLTSLQTEISEREIHRIEIEQQISRSENQQNQLFAAVGELDRSIQDKQTLLEDLDLDLGIKIALELEISSLLLQKQEHQDSLYQVETVLDDTRASISVLNTTFTSRQGQLDRVVNELAEIEARRQSATDLTIQSELYLQNTQEEIDRYSDTKQELEIAIGDLQNYEDLLKANLKEKECEIDRIEQQLIQLEKELKHSEIEQQEELPNTQAILSLDLEAQNESSEVIENDRDINLHRNCRSLYSNHELIDRAENFTNPQYMNEIWEDQILPFWLDRNKPKGQRFLGNVNISRDRSDELIDLVGLNLRQLDPFIEQNINRKFFNVGQDWIKIFTFALSEYACYYSDDQFWNLSLD